MTYGAKWSKTLIGVSAFSTLIIVSASGAVLYAGRGEGFAIGIAALTLSTLVGAILFAIRGYRLDGASLFVQRPLWETEVDLRGLESVAADSTAMKRTLRLFGNGGMYSVTGLFRNKRIGTFRAWVTNWNDMVVLRFSDRKPVVVSPSGPAQFVEDVLARVPNARQVAN